MESKNKKALKSGFWYTFSSFLLKGISFITVPIFTRLLTLDEFGQFNNYNSWLQIVTIFVTLCLQVTLVSAKYDFEKEFDEYVLSMFALSAVSVFFWTFLANVFKNFFVNFTDLSMMYINCMFVYLFFEAAFNLFQARERFLYKYKINVALSVLNAIGNALLSVLLVLTMSNRLNGRIFGSIISTIIIGFFIIVFFIKKGKKVDTSYWKYALKIVIPYIPHSISLILLSSMDRIMITKICGTTDTALYGLAYSCSLLLMIFVNSFNNAYVPWFADNLKEKKYDEIKKVSKYYILIFLYLSIGMLLIIPEALMIVGGKKYIEAKYVLAPVSLGCIYQFLYTLFVNVEQIEKKTKYMAFATVSAAVLNYILNYIFIRKFGYIAAAYTTVICYLWLLIIHMVIVRKLGYKDVYSYKFIIVISVISLLADIIISILYLNNIIRLTVIIGYMVISILICLKFKEKIISYIKQFKKRKCEKSYNKNSK